MFYLSFTGLFAAPPYLNRHPYLDCDGSFSFKAISEYIRAKQFACAHYIHSSTAMKEFKTMKVQTYISH